MPWQLVIPTYIKVCYKTDFSGLNFEMSWRFTQACKMIHCELSAVGTATEPDLSQSIINALRCPKKPNMLLIQAKTEWGENTEVHYCQQPGGQSASSCEENWKLQIFFLTDYDLWPHSDRCAQVKVAIQIFAQEEDVRQSTCWRDGKIWQEIKRHWMLQWKQISVCYDPVEYSSICNPHKI